MNTPEISRLTRYLEELESIQSVLHRMLLFIFWPLISASLLLLLALVFVITWPAILFGKVHRSQSGILTFSFLDKSELEAQDKP